MAMKKQPANGLIRVARAMAILFYAMKTASVCGATYVVTNTSDSGAGSLRQAILSANLTTNVPDAIHFNIPGAGPHTISPLTPLPELTDPLVIDGYSQPGASSNTLANGDNAMLQLVVREKLVIDTTNSTVRGLAIRQIQVGATSGPKGSNVIEGCFIGLDATGTNSLASPGFGVFVQTPNNRVGGTTPAARNLISGKGATGIEIFESFASNNVIQGNFIGTDRTGTKAIGNTDRALVVNMNASAALIGGEAAGAGNVISGNLDAGLPWMVQIITSGQPHRHDRNGPTAGQRPHRHRIGGLGNSVGGRRSGSGNVIAFNGVDGREVFTTNGVDVKPGTTIYTILGNSIFDNAGLGIDVKADGLVPGLPRAHACLQHVHRDADPGHVHAQCTEYQFAVGTVHESHRRPVRLRGRQDAACQHEREHRWRRQLQHHLADTLAPVSSSRLLPTATPSFPRPAW
jgi:hypothetical protein